MLRFLPGCVSCSSVCVILMFYACDVAACYLLPARYCYRSPALPVPLSLSLCWPASVCPLARLPCKCYANFNTDFWPFNWHTIFHSLQVKIETERERGYLLTPPLIPSSVIYIPVQAEHAYSWRPCEKKTQSEIASVNQTLMKVNSLTGLSLSHSLWLSRTRFIALHSPLSGT